MTSRFNGLGASITALIFSLFFISNSHAWTVNSSFNKQKSVIVSKFAKHLTWPNEQEQTKFVIGVYEDEETYQYFKEYFADKGVKNKDIAVELVTDFSLAKETNILYIPKPNRSKVTRLTARLMPDYNVLLMSDNSKNLSKTMINVDTRTFSDRIDVKVVTSNIENTELIVPALEFLSTTDNEDILSPSPSLLLQRKREEQANAEVSKAEKLISLESKLAKQITRTATLEKALQASNKKSKQVQNNLAKEVQSLKVVQQVSAEKDLMLKTKEQEIAQLKSQLEQSNAQLETQANETVDEVGLTNDSLQETTPGSTEVEATNNAEHAQKVEELAAEITAQQVKNTALKQQINDLNAKTSDKGPYQWLFFGVLLMLMACGVAYFLLWKKSKAHCDTPIAQSPVDNTLLVEREAQLLKSENIAALGYVATDLTYAVGLSLDELHEQFESSGNKEGSLALQEAITLLENFNIIAADQDENDVMNFDIVEYIRKIVMLYDFEFNQSKIGYTYSGTNKLKINAIPSYIALIMINLLNNAIKHGFDNKGKGKIAISVDSTPNGGAIIRFNDNGKGMSDETLARVFEPFYTTQAARGYVGIGMANTYNLITNELHGEITIESQEYKGTSITITLP